MTDMSPPNRPQSHDAARSFPRGLRRVRNNWAQEWTVGPFTFEVEWVPKASYFTFSLCCNFKPEDGS